MLLNQKYLSLKEPAIKQNRRWVRIASACNNKCIFCHDSDAQNGTFPKENEIKEKIKNEFKIWYDNRIIISGWEASINPKFAEYIAYAKNVGYNRIQTVTNWNMFANIFFCEKVFRSWLQEITFSFHGHNNFLHDYLVATPWAFKKSIQWLIYIKKNHPDIIINIDIVVNKINIAYLPNIVKFFIKLWIYEFDILQIIPFGKWFQKNKEKLFYNLEDYKEKLMETWKLSRIWWVFMWTNRFPVEYFEWYEDLIQDPRKIKDEVMWNSLHTFQVFIESQWKIKPKCYWDACTYCFQQQYCFDFIKNIWKSKLLIDSSFKIISWEESPNTIYEKYWKTKEDFLVYLNRQISHWKKLINIPKCLNGSWIYENYNDIKESNTIKDYTDKYIKHLYRKKSLNCKNCKYTHNCEWIHINFIRSYWFSILTSIKK